MQLANDFSDTEFECPCCGELCDMDVLMNFVHKLQRARDISEIPYVINSGHRCSKHNEAVGGRPDSAHLNIAADIRARTSRERFLILYGLIMAGFTRIGIAGTYIHVDDSTVKPQEVMWLYD